MTIAQKINKIPTVLLDCEFCREALNKGEYGPDELMAFHHYKESAAALDAQIREKINEAIEHAQPAEVK